MQIFQLPVWRLFQKRLWICLKLKYNFNSNIADPGWFNGKWNNEDDGLLTKDEKSSDISDSKFVHHERYFLSIQWQHSDVPVTLDAKMKSRRMAASRQNTARSSVCSSIVSQKHRLILIALVQPIFRYRRFDVTYASNGITWELTAE